MSKSTLRTANRFAGLAILVLLTTAVITDQARGRGEELNTQGVTSVHLDVGVILPSEIKKKIKKARNNDSEARRHPISN